MARRIALLLILLAMVASPAQADPDFVGPLGDPDLLVFAGNLAFTDDELRKGLVKDLEFVIAGHPDANLAQYEVTLVERISRGYRARGFADVSVRPNFDHPSQRLVIKIEEGLQYHCGRIEIVGARTLPVDEFRQALTTAWRRPKPRPASSGPIATTLAETTGEPIAALWSPGQPAVFGDNGQLAASSTVYQLFARFGYVKPAVSLRVIPEPDGTATLRVEIVKEGPRAMFRETVITGADRNTAAGLEAFLKLEPGSVLTPGYAGQLETTLWESARFRDYRVEFVPSDDDPTGAPSIARITVDELADVPLLNEEFSPEQSALLQFARWLERFHEQDADILIEGRFPLSQALKEFGIEPANPLDLGLQMAISPRDSQSLISAELRRGDDRSRARSVVHLSPGRLAVHLFDPHQRIEIAPPNGQLLSFAAITIPPRNPENRSNHLEFGTGIRERAQIGPRSFEPRLIVSPAWLMHQLSLGKLSISLTDDVATATLENAIQWRFQAGTGQLLDLATIKTQPIQLSARCGRGIFRDLKAQTIEQPEVVQSVNLGEEGLSAGLALVLGRYHDDAKCRFAREVIQNGGLREIDEFDWSVLSTYSGRFVIPPGPQPEGAPVAPYWAAAVFPISRSLLPRVPEFDLLARELAVLSSRRADRPSEAFSKLLQQNTVGPTWCLISGGTYGTVLPTARAAFARAGLPLMTQEGFENDCRILINDDWAVGQFLLASAETLQQFESDELQELCNALPLDAYDRRRLKKFLEIFPANKEDSPEEALKKAMREAWAPLLEWRLQGILTRWTF